MNGETTMLDAAIEYAHLGYHVFPVKPNKKTPLGRLTPHGVKDAMRDEALIRGWWAAAPVANIGVACGKSGIVVLDVDPQNGGEATFEALDLDAETNAALRAAPHVATPSGGTHAYFAAPASDADRRALGNGRAHMLGRGLDVQAGEKYVVAPPSLVGGKRYRWLEGLPPVTQLRPFPPALVALARRTTSEPAPPAVAVVSTDLTPLFPQGSRDDGLFRMALSFVHAGDDNDTIVRKIAALRDTGAFENLPGDEVTNEWIRAKVQSARTYDLSRTSRESHAADALTSNSPSFVRASDLIACDDDAVIEYALDGMLPRGGTAVLAGRPKAGKSTLALNVALAIARGENFLGRATQKGRVLYVALEGARKGWTSELVRLGVTPDDELYICINRAPADAIAWLRDNAERYRPVAIFIDTMQRLTRVKDGNDYATASNTTDAIIELARVTNATLVLLHHSGKTRREHIVDEVMGSTGWAAAVDSVLVMRSVDRARPTGEKLMSTDLAHLSSVSNAPPRDRIRTLASEQRFGEPLDEVVLEMDPDTHRITAASTREQHDRTALRDAIVTFVREYGANHPDDPWTDRENIEHSVEGRTGAKRKALEEAVEMGQLRRDGTGHKGDPYRFSDSCSLVPDYTSEQENTNPESDASLCQIERNACSPSGVPPNDPGSLEYARSASVGIVSASVEVQP